MAMNASLTVADWQRLNGLLAIVLDLEVEARTQWLESLGAEDRHLRPVLVDLLAQADMTGFAAETSPPTSVARMASAAISAMRREQAGDRIGPWQLERLLAEGGMGAVWVAQRADGVMKRTAALKLPRAEWVDHGLSQRLARERAILARLQHPHIAVLFDAGLADGGRPYLALEYVDGVPIDAYCQGRELKDVLRLMVQVVRAVAYAHGQLVIHRDLKPANVLVTADGSPKLLDFGISKLIEREAAPVEATALTRLAGRPMTLAYAAPEQVLALPITVAADVYALGVMLAELLAGARLYRSQEPRALEAEILTGDLRVPSAIASDKARARALKGDLDAIVATALKRQPQERYDSAAALADDLERYLDGEPVRARPDSRAYRLKKFIARNALAVGAASAIVLALGAGLGLALWQGFVARDQAARATALNTFVLGLIRTADPNASVQTKAADVAMLHSIEDRIDHDFKGSPDQLLQLRVTVGEAYKNRGEMVAAQRVFQRAVDDASSYLHANDLRLLTAQVRAADERLIVSTAAAEQLGRAIEILRPKSRDNLEAAELLLDALLIRSTLVNEYGVPAYVSPEENTRTVDEMERLALDHFGPGSRQHLRAVGAKSGLVNLRSGPEATYPILATAMEQARLRNDGVIDSVDFLNASAVRAVLDCATGKVPQGLDTLWRLNSAVRTSHGPTSYLLEAILQGIADCLGAVDDKTAFGWVQDAYDIAALRERPPSTNLLHRAIAAWDWSTGARDVEAAERYYQKAIENVQAFPEEAIRDRLTAGLRLGRVCQLAQRGDAAEAARVAEPLIAGFNADYARINRLTPNQGAIWICYSDALRQLGRYDEAVKAAHTFAERCRAILRFAPGARCEHRALSAKAVVQLDAGRLEEARATLDERMKLAPKTEGDPRFPLAFARVMIASGRGAEAIEVTRDNYGGWLSTQPASPYTAEALYWFGRAYQAAGDKRGDWMVPQARQALAKSPVSYHKALAAGMAF